MPGRVAKTEQTSKKSVFFEITAADITDILRMLGWSARADSSAVGADIISAVNGVNFNIRFGTPGKEGWLDFTVFATFDVDAEITPILGANWNRTQRFVRAYRTEKHLVMDMDIVVAHGVSRAHIRHSLMIWSDMVRLFLGHLKADRAVLAKRSAQARSRKANAGDVAVAHRPDPVKTPGDPDATTARASTTAT